MKGKAFVDTNVLVYLFSLDESDKRLKCKSFLEKFEKDYVLVWSTQVVQEFYQTMTSKLGHGTLQTKAMIHLFRGWELVTNNLSTIDKAIEIQTIYKYSFWDSLILSASLQSNCQFLITEDLNSNQKIDQLVIVNPLMDKN